MYNVQTCNMTCGQVFIEHNTCHFVMELIRSNVSELSSLIMVNSI